MQTIRALRRARGWTQFDLALAVGVQPQTVYLWESGRRQPQVSQMRKLGAVFGICSDEIDLVPAPDAHRGAPHYARTARRSSEPVPGRDSLGRAVFRSADVVDSGRDMAEAESPDEDVHRWTQDAPSGGARREDQKA
jgi:DNA-binding XRE family transcriptional regulator